MAVCDGRWGRLAERIRTLKAALDGDSASGERSRAVRAKTAADDAMRPCFNVQIATACGFVVGVKPTSQCNDHDLAGEMITEVQRVCGSVPCRLLADTGAMTQSDIVRLAAAHPGLVVYAPPVAERPGASPAAADRSRVPHMDLGQVSPLVQQREGGGGSPGARAS